MGVTAENVELAASGGDAAAAEVGKAASAIVGLGGKSDELKTKFQERFQHIGLQLFAGDALRASGLGAETRQVVLLLNTAIQEGGAMAGLSSGGVMLLVTAFVALAGVVVKIIEHHKSLNAELEKTNEANHKQLESTQTVIASIEAYVDATGKVPEYLKRWEDSERTLEKAQIDRQIQGDKAQLSSLTALMNQSRERAAQMKEEISDQERLTASLKASGVDQTTLTAQAAQLQKLRDEYDKQVISVEDYKAQIDKLIASIHLLRDNGSDDLKKLTEAAKAQNAATAKANKEAADAADAAWAEEANKRLDEIQAETAAMIKSNEQVAAEAKKVADQIGGDIGNAFAKSIVEGKKFADEMKNAFKMMAEQMITDIVRVLVEWMILQAATQGRAGTVMSMFGGFGGIGHAIGGEVMVDKPTLFLAGEAGPEIARFTPMSAAGSTSQGAPASGGQGGGDIYVSVTNHVTGNPDPVRFADTVGRYIIQQIRGAGQVGFVRG